MDAGDGWNRASAEVVAQPESLDRWQKLVLQAESENGFAVNKVASHDTVQRLRATYDALLDRFPLLVHYWARYVGWEFRLGNYERAAALFERARTHLDGSVELWTHYLSFKVETISDNSAEISELFESGRKSIGRHYYSHEFYELYLNFLRSYCAEGEQKYLLLLRTIVEQPIYHYNLFFRRLFLAISSVSEKNLALLVPQLALKNFTGDHRQTANKLKKVFTDLYITTQTRSYQIYSFERHLERQYFSEKFIPQLQLKTWHNYLSFLELNFCHQHVLQTYERCVLITGAYPEFWLRYADFQVSHNHPVAAAGVLTRGMVYCSSHKLLIKLTDVYLVLGNYTRARDLLLEYIKQTAEVPLPVMEKMVSVESLFETDKENLGALLRTAVDNKERLQVLLEYYSLADGLENTGEELKADSSDGENVAETRGVHGDETGQKQDKESLENGAENEELERKISENPSTSPQNEPGPSENPCPEIVSRFSKLFHQSLIPTTS